MKLELFCPSRKQVEYAKNIGVDLINALKLIAKFSVQNILEEKSKTITIDMDEYQAGDMFKLYGVDLSDHLPNAYIGEVNHSLNDEWTQGCPEIKLSEITEENIESAISTMDKMEWSKNIVTNAAVGAFIQESNKFSPILNTPRMSGYLYKIGTYENLGEKYEIYIDSYMSWNDSRMIFIIDK